MSSAWSLDRLLAELHEDIEQRLGAVRRAFGHPVAKGDACEGVWIDLFEKYLPRRYEAKRAHVVDSRGNFSQQIDIVIIDRQYSPFIFNYEGQFVVPAERVYAVLEAKQAIDAEEVAYAQAKAATVRALYRTNLPIPHAGGIFEPRELFSILAGIVTFESEWNPPLGGPLLRALDTDDPAEILELGCIAAHGNLSLVDGVYNVSAGGKPATAFLFDLIARLQGRATVPRIDVAAYAAWLAD